MKILVYGAGNMGSLYAYLDPAVAPAADGSAELSVWRRGGRITGE